MAWAARLEAIAKQRCPVCLRGKMFRGRVAMNESCPICGHRFEREQGFFQGAMYVSWVIGVTYLGVLVLLAQVFLVARIGIFAAAAVAIAVHLACIPALFRCSRTIWAHINVGTRT